MSTESHGGQRSYCLKYRTARILWPAETYAADDVSRERLRDLPFADFTLPCPRNSERYLDATYGVDWRNTGRSQDYNHVTRERESSVMAFEVTDNCEPARPFR